MSRLASPFGLAVVACLALAGWATWTGGVLDGEMARTVRNSSVYAAPGTGVDVPAAERVIGNRRLVVIFLAPGADLSEACDAVKRAAEGSLVALLSRDGDSYRRYGCSRLPGADGPEELGRQMVVEVTITRGVDEFVDQPVDAVKVMAVKYDSLVRAGIVPDGPRRISPSFPRYLIAAAAVSAVLIGSLLIFLTGRRAGRRAAARRDRLAAADDARTVLSASAAALAQQIVDLDARDPAAVRRLASDYTKLLDDLVNDDDVEQLASRVEALRSRL